MKQICHFDEICVTGCTGRCQCNNFWYSNWRKFKGHITYPFQCQQWSHNGSRNPPQGCQESPGHQQPWVFHLLAQYIPGWVHYNDVIMNAMASQITSVSGVCSTVCSGRTSEKTSKLRTTGLCDGNSPVTGEFPAQKASNAEDVSTWWRHHVKERLIRYTKFRKLSWY